MADYRNSEEFCSYYCAKGWALDKIGETNILIKQLPLIGTVIRIQRGPLSTSLEELDKYAKSKKAVAVAIEPDITTDNNNYSNFESELVKHGFSDLNLFLSPTKTTCVDLLKSEAELFEKLDHDLKKAISNSQDIEFKFVRTYEEIYKLLKDAGYAGSYYVQNYKNWVNQWKGFGDDLRIVLATKNGILLGGNMYLIKKPKAYGLFLPSTEAGKKTKISAVLIWQALLDSKKDGCHTFDLNGLYDDRYHAPRDWEGLSQFKKKFNGHELMYMHPKAKIYSKWLKPLERSKMLWAFFMTL